MKQKKGFKLGILLVILVVITGIGTGITYWMNAPEEIEEDNFVIVTSFYPVYIATMNLTEGMEAVEVVNLMSQQGGCLHDYQLTTHDMKQLERADVFIMNGAGMEGYIEEVAKS